MASKMLVSVGGAVPAYYCVPCGNARADAASGGGGWERLQPSNDVGEQVCAACGGRIAGLPEPPLLDFSVGQAVTMRVDLQASSLPEAQQLAFDALRMDGVDDYEVTSQDSWPL
jgi:hypothetical protein